MENLEFLRVWKWLFRGKSVARALLNCGIADIGPLKGTSLDLGGGSNPSYKSLLQIEGEYLVMDAIEEIEPDFLGNLEEAFPVKSGFADNLLLINTLEHVFDHDHVISECYRVLKPSGQLIIYVPFLIPFHTHRTDSFLIDDYFRYTESTLQRLLSKAGFVHSTISPQGGLFLSVAELLGYALFFAPLRCLSFLALFPLEKLHRVLRPTTWKRFPLAYFVIAYKHGPQSI